jgi:excisionase family DNA binding protein
MTQKVLLTMNEVVARLGITLSRGYELARLRMIPIVKLGRQVRVDPDALEQFIQTGGQALPGGWKKQ